MPCALSVVVPAGIALTAAIPGGVAVPAGALVRATDGACEGVAVEVLNDDATVAPAARGPACLPVDALVPAVDWHLIVDDADLGPLPAEACGDVLGRRDLAGARVAAPGLVEGLQAVIDAYGAPIGLGALRWTVWGRVSLPLTPRTPTEIAATWAAEGLDTPVRREKAVIAVGPRRGDAPVYDHFLGSDAAGSDTWGTPAGVAALLRLFSAWFDACGGGPACTVHVGDLGWYGPRRPDPLGHLDHWKGNCADLRLFRTDGSAYEAYWDRPDDRPGRGAAYDRARTQAFLAFAMAFGATEAWFGDPVVVAAVPGVGRRKGHDDHVHVCL